MRIALAKDGIGLGKYSEGCDLKYSEGIGFAKNFEGYGLGKKSEGWDDFLPKEEGCNV